MLTSDGRRLLVGWMGVPEGEEMLQPTLTNGWIHQMTCLRELEFIDGQLYQRPLRELSALRGEAHGWAGTLPLAPMEIVLQTAGDDMLSLDFGGALTLERDASGSAWPDAVSPATRSISLLARRRPLAAYFHRPVERGDFHQRRRRGDEQPLLPGLFRQLMFSGITPDAFCYWPLRTCMVE
jgi:beta-fructofuranosidase